MKTSTFITSVAFGITMLLSSNVNAQKFPDLDKSPMDMASYPNDYKDPAKLVRIIYSRPQLKGRDLSTLIPKEKFGEPELMKLLKLHFTKT